MHGGWTILWTTVILFLTLSPKTPDAGGWLSSIPHIDKLVHLGLFAIWALLMQLYFKQKRNAKSAWLVIALAGIALAGATEYFQSFVPNRQTDVIDFLFDLLGVGLGILFTFLLKIND